MAAFNRHDAEGVNAATQLSNEAETRLRGARSLFETATAGFEGADYSAFIAYVDAKIGLVTDAREIDALWLAGKLEESNARLSAYNARDAEIVAMAKALPASVRDPVADAYDRRTVEATTRYFAARDRARAADEMVARIRNAPAQP